MSNTLFIHLNNSAVDALQAGDLYKATQILSRTFFDSISDQHRRHNLHTAQDDCSLAFSLHDCSKPLQRIVNKGSSKLSDDSHLFLSLNFLRINLPSGAEARRRVDNLCSCAVSWAIGYNLAIVYAILGFQGGAKNGGAALLKKAVRILLPIKKQVMQQRSPSSFWTNLKLSMINNSICILRECGTTTIHLSPSIRVMEELLSKSRGQLDPVDLKKYYFSVQFLNASHRTAAAA